MTWTDIREAGDALHAIDIVESLAEDRSWEFDRIADDRIAVAIEGQWRTYALSLSIVDDALRLVCSFEMDPPSGRQAALLEAINLANDGLWGGSFSYWAEQRLMVWRYGLLLADGQPVSEPQVDRMLRAALMSCERFYPAFQLVCWGERAPSDALQVAIAEAYGRA